MPFENKKKSGRGRPTKRQREEPTATNCPEVDENQNNPVLTSVNLEKNFELLIKTGIDLFNKKISTASMSYRERLAYFEVLRKITSPLDWKLERIISNKYQLNCLNNRELETEEDVKNFKDNVKNFIKFKLKTFPGHKNVSAENIAMHYKSELKCFGVTVEKLKEEINKLNESIQKAEGITPQLKPEKQPKSVVKILNMYKHICRLCGSKNKLIYNINQRKDDIQFKDIVEDVCRIKLSDSENLPQLVCKSCKDIISNFSNFSLKVLNFQKTLSTMQVDLSSQQKNVKIEKNIDLDDNDVGEDAISNDDGICIQENFRHSSIEELDLDISKDDSVIGNTEILDLTENVVENLLKNIDYEIDNIISSSEQFEIVDRANINSNRYNPELLSSTPEVPIETNQSLHPLVKNLKNCSIRLYRLPINYVPSDSEGEIENLTESPKAKRSKRKTKNRSRMPSNIIEINSTTESIPNLDIVKQEILDDDECLEA